MNRIKDEIIMQCKSILTFLILSFSYPPDQSGTTTRTMNIIKGLKKAGMNIFVISSFPRKYNGAHLNRYRHKLIVLEKDEYATIIRVWVPQLEKKGFQNRLLLYSIFMLNSILAVPYLRNIDIIWAADPNIFSVYSGYVFKLIHKCTLIQNVNDLWPEEGNSLGLFKSRLLYNIARSYTKGAFHLSDIVTVTSPAYSNHISHYYGIAKSKFYFLPVGVGDNFDSNKNDVKSKSFIILYIGSLSIAYDFEIVLNAAKSFLSYENVFFMIIGKGEEANRINEIIKSNDLTNVIFINRFYDNHNIKYIINAASLTLLPLKIPHYRGISTKLFEYQALGKPIVCISDGIAATYVTKTKSGIVVNPRDVEGLVNSILMYYNNPQLIKKMGDNGKKVVNKHYKYDHISKKLITYLQINNYV
jgi:colanic acid biosynthesis glycosyl transferase WcaI